MRASFNNFIEIHCQLVTDILENVTSPTCQIEPNHLAKTRWQFYKLEEPYSQPPSEVFTRTKRKFNSQSCLCPKDSIWKLKNIFQILTKFDCNETKSISDQNWSKLPEAINCRSWQTVCHANRINSDLHCKFCRQKTDKFINKDDVIRLMK